jgi:T5SS/PEP-CTERM-associated repeat protein
VVLVLQFIATPVDAQFTDNFQTNSISGVTSNWSGNYYVGNGMVFDQLQLINGGELTVPSGTYTQIGSGSTASNNSVLVSGSGSILNSLSSAGLYIGYISNGNSLTVTNGGTVYCSYGAVGSASSQNNVLVAGSGSVWGSTGDIWIRGSSNIVTIANGGTGYDNGGGVGIDGDYDTMVVTGSGSVWKNLSVGIGDVGRLNTLIVTNGGVVFDGYGIVGMSQLLPLLPSSDSNAVVVTGNGSVWNNTNDLHIGVWSTGNSMTVTNGGAVYDVNAYVGTSYGSYNAVLISGNGSTWRNQGDLYIGLTSGSSFNRLKIDAGGSVIADNVYVGSDSSTVGNSVTVSGGALYVTNALGTGLLSVQGGVLTIDGGNVIVDQIVAVNGPINSVIAFNGGLLSTKGTSVNNGSAFTIVTGQPARCLR